MNKAELITSASKHTSLTTTQVSRAVDALIQVVKYELRRGQRLGIPEIGVLFMQEKVVGGEQGYYPCFKPSKAFVEFVKDKY